MEQASDFRDETHALAELVAPLSGEDFEEVTQFKSWTINEVLRHLHFWNRAADLQLTDEAGLERLIAGAMAEPGGMRAFERKTLDGLSGRALADAWLKTADAVAARYAGEDPKRRLKWAGPPMSARSSMTARLMETWAHGQEIYDALGVERQDGERIRNIAHLGVSTFGWTYAVRKLSAPERMPHVRLRSPSGAVWTWGETDEENLVAGSATEFCQVVTQVRNVADTSLELRGPTAREWMSMAQCFAGPPETPPAPGTRFRRTS